MECDCCKEINPADYEKYQQDLDRILRNKKLTSSKQYIAPYGESFTFGAKFTISKKNRKRKR